MNVTVSKWGNSLGIRIPSAVIRILAIKDGDTVDYEVRDDSVVLYKNKSTKQLFEEFYGKNFSEITQDDLGPTDLVDFGGDVGGELF